MPHDKNGNKLNVGDKVVLTGTVESITADNEYCNAKVRFDETEGAKAAPGAITFNSAHCELLGKPVEGVPLGAGADPQGNVAGGEGEE